MRSQCLGNWDSGSFSCLHFGQTGLYPLGTTGTRGPSALVILGPHIVNRAWVCVWEVWNGSLGLPGNGISQGGHPRETAVAGLI